MTLTVEDDFREFVAARWPDLAGVAYVIILDPAAARRVTAEALATLHQHWREALDEGRPGSMARRSVLTAALAVAPPGRGSAAAPTVPGPDTAATRGRGSPPAPSPGAWGDLHDDTVLTALDAVVRAATPLERALVAAGSIWAAEPDEVAELLGMPAATVRASAAGLRARLVVAHDQARAADGLAPADWALDVDLEAVIEHLLAGQGDPPDPTALVEDRRRSVRRRSVVAGGAAALAAGAVGWWLLPGGASPAGGGASASPSPTGLPSPGDPSWRSPSRWAPRGGLAADARVQGLVLSHSNGASRLLFADDVAGRRVVVTGTLNAGTEDLILQAWQGAAGDDPSSLEELPFQGPFVGGEQEAMVLAVPTFPGTLLLVLARPSITAAAYSSTVLPTARGTVHRDWVDVPLRAGIGSVRWPQEAGPALRARCGEFDGPVIGTAQTWVGQTGPGALAGFAEETNRLVAAATGQPVGSVRTQVVADATVAGSVIDATAISATGGDGRVRVLRTTTRGGAVVRSVRVVDDGRSRMSWLDLEPPSVLPADAPLDEPIVLRLEDERPRWGRFLVIAPGAARVQLLSTSPSAYPLSKVTPSRGGIAIVEVVNADDAAGFRLVRRDASGHRFGDGVPLPSRNLLDLWPSDFQPGL